MSADKRYVMKYEESVYMKDNRHIGRQGTRKGAKCFLTLFLTLLLTLMLAVIPTGQAQAAAGDIVRCSTTSLGAQANAYSNYPEISSDGRYVAFTSVANNLVGVDTNAKMDVFRKDLQTGATVRCSTSAGGGQSKWNSQRPSISSDGRYVAFQSTANDLVGETMTRSHIYRKDLQTGAIVLCSTSSTGVQADYDCEGASISSDGRYVVFQTPAYNLVAGDSPGSQDIFRKDLQTGDIVRCSTDSAGMGVGAEFWRACISTNGRYVAFAGSGLVAGNTNTYYDIFRKDLQTGAVVCCSTDSTGGWANNYSERPHISSDGRYVVFYSPATDLVDGDTNNQRDVFRKDVQTGAILRCSTDFSGGQTDFGHSDHPCISSDGRYVAFDSYAADLVDGDTNDNWDIFRKELTVPVPPAPSITSVSPKSGAAGTKVTISGKNFGTTCGTSYVKFGTVKATSYVSWSDTKIVCKVPAAAAGAVNLSMTTSAGKSNLLPFKVLPRITKMVPKTGAPGTVVTITGTGFGDKRGTSCVKFGTTKVTKYTSWSNTKIVCKVPTTGAGAKAVKVTTAGGVSGGVTFTVK